MKDIKLKGYINFNSKGYTFIYENQTLKLIGVEPDTGYCFDQEIVQVEYFEGFLITGNNIIFYINNKLICENNCYTCKPRAILVFKNNSENIENIEFDAISFTGGCLNQFYSNRDIIEYDKHEWIKSNKDRVIKIKNIEKSIATENINISGTDIKCEFSINYPSIQDNGSISIGEINTLLRMSANDGFNYNFAFVMLGKIDRLFSFLSNMKDIKFSRIVLEKYNREKKYESLVEIFIPYMIDNEISKNTFTYELIKGKLNELIKTLDECEYLFNIIPTNHNEQEFITPKEYCSMFSCFQSLYRNNSSNIIKNNELENETMKKKENDLEEIKNEIIEELKKIDNGYKGENKNKRDFIKSFENIINSSSLKLEKQIIESIKYSEISNENLKFIIGEENINISDIICKGVETRDILTHNRMVKLDKNCIITYKILKILNFILVLKGIGVDRKELEKQIIYLSNRDII